MFNDIFVHVNVGSSQVIAQYYQLIRLGYEVTPKNDSCDIILKKKKKIKLVTHEYEMDNRIKSTFMNYRDTEM